MISSLDKHIEELTDLIEVCETPSRESHAFFFMRVPQYMKGRLAEEFAEPDPTSMNEVFKCARKHEIAKNLGDR